MTTRRGPEGPAAEAVGLEAAQGRGFEEALADFRRRLEGELTAFFAGKRESVPGGADGVELVDGIERLVAGGGKRLRPALVYHAYRGCGGRRDRAALSLALSTELLHTYLLIHDDIMDRGEVRRGQPAVHVRFGRLHRERAWPGDSEHFGRSMAILLGDLAQAWAVEQYGRARAEAGLPSPGGVEALDRAFSAMCEEVIVGQYLEMQLPCREVPGEEELLRVLRLKSGCYSVERPVELGALLAGAPEASLRGLREYGAAVGEVFQLQDDILGIFGDAAAVGKPVGADLAEGKVTFLIHHALRSASRRDGARLRSILGRRDLGAGEVREARRIIRESGGLRAVRAMVEARLEAAGRALDKLTLEPDASSFFQGLIAYSRERDR